jgi:hypothetical protein
MTKGAACSLDPLARPVQNMDDARAVLASWHTFPERYPEAEERDDRLVECFAYCLADICSQVHPDVWRAVLTKAHTSDDAGLRELIELAFTELVPVAVPGTGLPGAPVPAGATAFDLKPPPFDLVAHVRLAVLLRECYGQKQRGPLSLDLDDDAEGLLDSMMIHEHRARREAALLGLATQNPDTVIVRRN